MLEDGEETLRTFIMEQNLRKQDGDCAFLLVDRQNAMLPSAEETKVQEGKRGRGRRGRNRGRNRHQCTGSENVRNEIQMR